jgi:hypothetical protein
MLAANLKSMSAEKAQLVRYIRDMGREMAKLANDASLDLLAYLLSLVVLEAETLSASDRAAGRDDSSLQD